jgi:putative FmdB family regulatory protein
MPTYEYECSKCGHVFEKFQSMSEPPAKRCPACRGGVKRLIGAGAGILFKGTGFYETDYKKKSGGSEKRTTGSADPKAESKKTDSKAKAESSQTT